MMNAENDSVFFHMTKEKCQMQRWKVNESNTDMDTKHTVISWWVQHYSIDNLFQFQPI